jgi:hypothetical protein
VLPAVMSAEEVSSVLALVEETPFDGSTDSVDGMPTRELYLYTSSQETAVTSHGDEEADRPHLSAERHPLRLALGRLLQPAQDRITAFVRETFPDKCARSPSRACRPCFSLLRRYLPGERDSHALHRDGQALFTAVLSLTTSGRDFGGGLYVAAGSTQRKLFLALQRGDAVVHSYDLLHGVRVDEVAPGAPPPRRWSWILWYKDSATCEQFGHEWSRAGAERGDPLEQYLHGWRLKLDPTLSPQQVEQGTDMWYRRAAQGGLPEAMFHTGRRELGRGKVADAIAWFHRARAEGEADASYQLGYAILAGLITPPGLPPGEARDMLVQVEALKLFKEAARAGTSAYRGASFAMYNLGVAWLFGFAGLRKDPSIAAQWFKHCGQPEGTMYYARILRESGKLREADEAEATARKQGFPRSPAVRDFALFTLLAKWPSGPIEW